MNSSARSFVIPFTAATLGVLTALALARVTRTDLNAAHGVRRQFDELARSEQEELLKSAERFANRDQAEQERIKQLHAVVSQDPQLQRKLAAYNAWWEQLDSVERYRLKADGEFVQNWVTEAEAAYQESRKQANEFVVRFESRDRTITKKKITEKQFEAFLDAVIPENTEGLAERLAQFPVDAHAARTLTKLTWHFTRNVRLRPKPGDGPEADRGNDISDESPEFSNTREAARQHLDVRNVEDARQLMPRIISAAIDHYDTVLLGQQTAHSTEQYLTTFASLPREEQMEVMQMDRTGVWRELQNQAMTDPALAALREDIRWLTRIMANRWQRPGGRGSGGFGQGGRGPGNRGPGGFGRGGRGPDGRGPEDRGGPRERDRGRGSPPSGGRDRQSLQ